MNIKNTLPIVIFLMGSTASGKTHVVLHLRNNLPIDIISVDSGLIYKEMNIGTAKPTISDLLKHPHRLINIRDPVDIYSVEDFRKDALYEINKIILNKRIPILVGGTMLYYKSLLNGLVSLPSSNLNFRSKIKNNIIHDQKSLLHQYLQKIDYQSSLSIHPNDIKKIIRAIEIFLASGKNLTTHFRKEFYCFPYNVLQFFLVPFSRSILHNRIENRFKNMLDMGFEKEVEKLFNRGDLHFNLPSIQHLGYRQMWKYLSGKCTYDDMIFKSICSTRQFAKRQITWSQKWKNLFFIDSDNLDLSVTLIYNIISDYINKFN
ncbi:tRNA dimethylallyltransferase [Buchnera aphidicola (Eriosoma lanigerum)]|uniref:tRNA (adenosine(37)-N6)-dimethylallyltransferase MiaA n=1 Tax=Buchnera aphidicola TaxID=9 RepID=UPI0034646808